MRRLDICKVEFFDEAFLVKRIEDFNVDMDKLYGVVFEDGLYIEPESRSMGTHMRAFAIGCTIYLSEHSNDFIDTFECTGLQKFDELQERINNRVISIKNDISEIEDFYVFPTLLSYSVKEDSSDFDNIKKTTAFFGAMYEQEKQLKVLDEFAHRWIKEYRTEIWLIRTLCNMMDNYSDDFWAENSISYWKQQFKENGINIKLPTKSSMINYSGSKYYNIRQLKPKIIDVCSGATANGKKIDASYIMETYPQIRRMLGYESFSLGSWEENFYDVELDHLIFKVYPEESPMTGSQINMMEFYNKDNGKIMIYDDEMNMEIKVDRADVLSMDVSHEKDYTNMYISFVSPKDMMLRRVYYAGDKVSNFSIDEGNRVIIIE